MPVGSLPFDSLVSKASLNEDQVRRALQWLSSKGLVSIEESKRSKLEVVRTPPELVLVSKVVESPRPMTVDELKAQFGSAEEFSAAFGRARASGWINLEVGPPSLVRIGDLKASEALNSLLKSFSAGVDEKVLPSGQSALVADLLKRGVLRRVETRSTSVKLTETGKASAPISTGTAGTDLIDRLTTDILASGAWKGKRLRPIDVEARAPRFYPGRRHPVRDFIQEVRETYISMGFTELQGDSVHPAFWNFDALFIPQDHPGRDMQDTFYLDGLSENKMSRTGVVANVASTHENGWKTGSRGWGYRWRIEEARRLVLKSHNTVLSVRALAESKEKETRVFAV